MTNPVDRFTGKPAPEAVSQRLPRTTKEVCETCGTQIIDRCLVCGAPQCCPKCCHEAYRAMEE